MNLAADPGFPLLVRRLEGESLPALAMYKDKCLQRRLAVRMRACGARTLAEYVTQLDTRPEEVERLRAALTINVTQFYRNPTAWARLGAELTTDWWEGLDSCRAWSAGCSSGEETYTLAMVLTEAAECLPAGRQVDIRVEGTDVDPACLAAAREAWYPLRSLAEAPTPQMERWTVPDGEGRRVAGPIRSRTRFHHHDIGTELAPGGPYDVIACRNVLIYFERSTQERVLLRLAGALRPGGMLLLGKVEMLVGAARDQLETVDGRERLFRRRP
jgi:chemotaxis methyl-accepting protein methylase